MRKDAPSENSEENNPDVNDGLHVDPDLLMQTTSLTHVSLCRSPERKSPKKISETNGSDESIDPRYYALQIIAQLLDSHGVKNVGVDILRGEGERNGIRITAAENEQAGLAQFFEGLNFMFGETEGVDIIPETGSLFFAEEDGLFHLVTGYLSAGATKDGTPLLEYSHYKQLHDQMLKGFVNEIETPRWRKDFALHAAANEDVVEEDLEATRRAYSKMPNPQSAKVLSAGLHSAASASQNHLRQTPIPQFECIVGYSTTYNPETGMTNYELIIPDLVDDLDMLAWDHLDAFADDLECFPESARLRRLRYVEETEDGVPICAGYVLSCKNPKDLFVLLDAYYTAHNLQGPDEVCDVDYDQFVDANGKFESQRFKDYFDYRVKRGEGLIAKHPGALALLPGKSYRSMRAADADLPLSTEAAVPVSIERIRDVVYAELGIPVIGERINGFNLVN